MVSAESTEEEKAATKIQSIQRGRQARNEVKAKKAASAGEESSAPVKCTFVIAPENYKHTIDFPVNSNTGGMISKLAEDLHVGRETMTLRYEGQYLAEGQTLESLGLKAGGTAQLELVVEIKEARVTKTGHKPGQLPETIDVEIDLGGGEQKRVVQVQIELSSKAKMPWLGGYRSKRTGVEYLHAVCQTDKKPVVWEKDKKFSRETQTYEQKTRTQQTVRDASTQMSRPDLILDDSMDREMESGMYMTSEEFHQLRVKKTIVIQRYSRGWKARKRAAELRFKREERQKFLAQEALRKQKEAEERRRREIERRMRPRTSDDFEILYNELEAWRLQETQKINEAGLPEPERHAALQQLLHKETKLLQTIDRLKISANSENRDTRIAHTLADMAAPKQWEVSDGTTVEVHTPFTTRSKELMQLYNGLRLPLLTTDERLDVLLHVKWTVKEFDCNLTREIVELIDREADLLNRGRSPKSMEGLHRRIANLFLQFIETPEFNPEATRYQIVPGDFEMEVPNRSRLRNMKGTQTIMS
mmetsp:Transcript_42450/g.51468  ORF Transcript_42450/g.51468 Transcript_42450/m.51468 type:complete len:531 (+) Transcript_42450:224-1816(+)|eukprot:CAMPEP_0197860530 /NCGR_PEP_ID=MMETSP1438-20131217/35954_1 /TAXON_ID=1461541 /ORGANISM="Pterosperma sp., Strain CCMP1384" /LENGTH=530 /DNA_ID=CAMNT_0043477423 /DNA_START=224 /DNA_END=1816 /DNA_ORIENTATION=-